MIETTAEMKARSEWVKNYIKQNKLIHNINSFHGFTYQVDKDGLYTFGMAQHITYDYWIGRGKTLDAAIKNSLPVIKTYDEKFRFLMGKK